MRVLSLGAGNQSSTLLLMACEGEEQIDAAVFADTQWEAKATYAWLGFPESRARQAGIPVYRVTAGDIRDVALNGWGQGKLRKPQLPLRLRGRDGRPALLRRQCTQEFKLVPIRRQLRALGASRKRPIDQLLGISLDEIHRMRDPDVQYLRNVYPLIEKRMTRHDCSVWLAKHGYPEPQKSACIGCPFRRNVEWRSLTPDEWADAVDFDSKIRGRTRTDSPVFLHPQLVPLEMADLRDERDRGQLDLFDGCGVLCPSDGAA